MKATKVLQGVKFLAYGGPGQTGPNQVPTRHSPTKLRNAKPYFIVISLKYNCSFAPLFHPTFLCALKTCAPELAISDLTLSIEEAPSS